MKKASAHIIVLDPRSIAGQIYLNDNDGFVDAGQLQCPSLLCIEIETNNPHGISAKRRLKAPKKYQSLFLPYGSVALVFDWDAAEFPFGFAPKKS